MADFKVGDHVIAPCSYLKSKEKGEILGIKDFVVYVHFSGKDRRYDEKIPIFNLEAECDFDNCCHIFSKKTIQTKSDENKRSNIRIVETIRIREFEIQAWYYSPYPKDFCPTNHLFICDFCLRYFATVPLFVSHVHSQRDLRPPGIEIYRYKNISIFEVSPNIDRVYCQSLFLLGKLFIEKSILDFNVDKFMFYVLCECDQNGAHFIGYFVRPSKMRCDIVVSEIFVLPPYQRKGYAQIMLSCAYEIAHRVSAVGGAGRAYTDLGKLAFEKFFRNTIIHLLQTKIDVIHTVTDISLRTSICRNDVVDTLSRLNLVERDFDGERVDEKLPIKKITSFLEHIKNDDQTEVFVKNRLMWFVEEFEEEEEISQYYSETNEEDSDDDENGDEINCIEEKIADYNSSSENNLLMKTIFEENNL